MTNQKLNPPGKPGATSALHVLLTFVRVLPGTNPLAQLDAETVFQDMRSELADVTASDLVIAAGLADQIGKQMRSVSWRLRYGRDAPKTRPKLDKGRLRPIRAGARRFEPNDPRLLACPGVIEQWRQHLGLDRKWRVQDVIRCALEVDELRAVLVAVADGAGGTVSAQKLGTWLSQVEGVECDRASLRCIEGKLYPRWVLVED